MDSPRTTIEAMQRFLASLTVQVLRFPDISPRTRNVALDTKDVMLDNFYADTLARQNSNDNQQSRPTSNSSACPSNLSIEMRLNSAPCYRFVLDVQIVYRAAVVPEPNDDGLELYWLRSEVFALWVIGSHFRRTVST